jgi:hypothetical protein
VTVSAGRVRIMLIRPAVERRRSAMNRGVISIGMVLLLASAAWAQTTPSGVAPVAAPGSSNTLRLLNQRIPEVTFEGVPFEQVMDWVKELTGANVVVHWQTLSDAGVERDKPLTIKVKNLRLSQVLWMIMNEAGGSDVKLAYRASGSLIILSTAEELGKEMITKVYDVSDLLTSPTRFSIQSTMDPSQVLNNQNSGGTGGSSGGSGGQLFQGMQNNEQGQNQQQTSDADIQKIIDLITSTIESDTWMQNGGTGQIVAFHSMLVVTNSLMVHQKIGGYLVEGGTSQ